tara:strand:+ start:678 stop:872 length:195 start_codon:yes stop_codon:yes gene_type:complete
VYQLELIKFKDILLKVNRKFREQDLHPNFDTNVMKEWTRTDTLLRKNGILYCCETIQDAEIIEQ